MKTKHFILASIISFFTVNSFASEVSNETDTERKTEKIFTSKDKDYLQLWHYDQVLKMDLSEELRDDYFAVLNSYTYKMSKLGLSEHHYTESERKHEFEKMADKLDAIMKRTLNPSNYIIHDESFDKIEHIVYEKRNWEE